MAEPTHLRIVPADPDSPRTQGTRVLMPDGSEVPNVKEVRLIAKPGGYWTAEIICSVLAPSLTAVAVELPGGGVESPAAPAA